jgi:2-hydroxychromene-2-carboxylate isomerase
MTRASTIEFSFEFASRYSSVAAEEIDAKRRDAEIDVAQRCFLLAPIFALQGWTDSRFNIYPAKGAYVWRDVETLCTRKKRA